jgi:hypothetical protein
MSKEKVQVLYKELALLRVEVGTILAKIGEPELALLKGHLLIEEILFDLAKHKMLKAAPLEKARLSFAQVVALVEGLYHGEDVGCSWLYPACHLLNKIRNRLAHSAKPEGLENEIKNFVSFVLSKCASNVSPENPLKYALGTVHANLAAILTIHKKVELIPRQLHGLSFDTRITMSKLIANDDLPNSHDDIDSQPY